MPERRREAGLSQAALAAALGVTRQTSNADGRDRDDPSLELAFALAAFFETDVESLFEPEDLPAEPVSRRA